MTTALGLPRSKFRSRSMKQSHVVLVSDDLGLKSTYETGITCSSSEIALIYKIVFTGLTRDAAANETVTLKVNGHELPFHFVGQVDKRKSFRRVWRTNGNLVVHPGHVLQAKGTTVYSAPRVVDSIEIHYRKVSYMQALQEGLLEPGGTLPNVASTNSIATGGLSAGTAKKIINNTDYTVPFDGASGTFTLGETLTLSGGGATARLIRIDGNGTAVGTMTFQMLTGSVPVDDDDITGGTSSATAFVNGTPSSNTGRYIQILGLTYTGHNYNAAQDSARIGFWDGTTGSFAANANRFFKAFAMGATPEYAPDIWIGDTHGCIQGAQGLHVYVDATANLAGATPTGDFVVLYRYINTKDVASATGAAGATTAGNRFWVYTESDPAQTGTSVQWFGSGMPTVDCHILGHAGTFTCVDEVAPNTCGIGLGATSTLPISGLHLLNSDAAAAPAEVSSSFFDEDLDIRVSTAFTPCFTGTAVSASGTDRAHLAWGRMGSSTQNQTGSAPANVSRFG